MSSVLGPGWVRAEVIGPDGNPVSSGNPLPVAISALGGVQVTIGGDTFEVDAPRTIYGLQEDRPNAATTHGVVPFAFYVSVDTVPTIIEQTDGSAWRRV